VTASTSAVLLVLVLFVVVEFGLFVIAAIVTLVIAATLSDRPSCGRRSWTRSAYRQFANASTVARIVRTPLALAASACLFRERVHEDLMVGLEGGGVIGEVLLAQGNYHSGHGRLLVAKRAGAGSLKSHARVYRG
jgi:hypothetical protein